MARRSRKTDPQPSPAEGLPSRARWLGTAARSGFNHKHRARQYRASRGEKPMKKVDVKLTHQSLWWALSCTLCGNSIEKQHVGDDVLAQGHDSEREGDNDVTICASCLASENIDALIGQRAAQQQAAGRLQRAVWLRSLTGRLNLPAYADYRAAVDEIAADIERAMQEARSR
jgi:hypothetical protein